MEKDFQEKLTFIPRILVTFLVTRGAVGTHDKVLLSLYFVGIVKITHILHAVSLCNAMFLFCVMCPLQQKKVKLCYVVKSCIFYC